MLNGSNNTVGLNTDNLLRCRDTSEVWVTTLSLPNTSPLRSTHHVDDGTEPDVDTLALRLLSDGLSMTVHDVLVPCRGDVADAKGLV